MRGRTTAFGRPSDPYHVSSQLIDEQVADLISMGIDIGGAPGMVTVKGVDKSAVDQKRCECRN